MCYNETQNKLLKVAIYDLKAKKHEEEKCAESNPLPYGA